MQYSIKQALGDATDKLNKIGINSSQLEARILLRHVINKPLQYLLINLDEQLNQSEIEAFEKLLERRLKHEPIAYIIGVKEFYSREFIVNKHVLIPRGNTELLIDIVVELVKRCHSRESGYETEGLQTNNIKILELGTGSGCIAISLLCELPNANIIATDISLDAIEVARNNALKHHVTDRVQIIHSNWFENIENQKFDFIVSNPPYISNTEKSEMATETINYEPHLALFAEENGLQSYKTIAENAKTFLKQNGKLALEIGFKQEETVTQIFLDQGYNIESVYKDLQDYSRVILFSPINLNRSYARRIGKSLSSLQQNLLDTELPKYLFSKEKLIDEVFIEIGFGMGEHFINQAKMNPNALFIGVEVYLNGVANVLKLAGRQNITNFLLFPNNLDFILNDLPNNSLDSIYILFPNPWTKNKQKKKRIFNKERLKVLQDKLKDNGNLVFASDIENYFYEVIERIEQNGNFEL